MIFSHTGRQDDAGQKPAVTRPAGGSAQNILAIVPVDYEVQAAAMRLDIFFN
jgi:hypothetical protein